jgi:hypothetical protein
MWTLIFVFSMHNNTGSNMATIVVPNFKTEQACLVAQKALIEQTTRRYNYVKMNMCVKGE